ncbi:hypothetical protein F2Q68_00024601 [Brassica cretica]|uniref:ATP synthase subunit gamma, mitochondrial n=1 Tax=Brassica cretica TaxID=69181 RepID=A0A8S9IC46_BRACR|nr:hypothetical protein F2Q68_00024601 [Brassica cretica]
MAMAVFRREGRRLIPSIAARPIAATPSPLSSDREEGPLGVRSISTQVVRNRMKSVKNIQKITKAMKMVAASKLRAVQGRAENSRGLWQPFTALLGDNPTRSSIFLDMHPRCFRFVVLLDAFMISSVYFMAKPGIDVKKSVVVTLSSDKGLCGGINSTVVKFHSVVAFLPTVATVLSPEIIEKESEVGGKLGELDSYEIEGGETKGEILQNLAEFQFSCVMFNAVLENACSEMGARMSAMDSSSRNAGEMLDRLTLTYNRTRQASITTELIEIISGASALEAAK